MTHVIGLGDLLWLTQKPYISILLAFKAIKVELGSNRVRDHMDAIVAILESRAGSGVAIRVGLSQLQQGEEHPRRIRIRDSTRLTAPTHFESERHLLFSGPANIGTPISTDDTSTISPLTRQ